MGRLKKRFEMLFVRLALILFASLLAAQGPPNPCANTCWQSYLNAVKACHGDGACLGAARAEAEHCILGCHLTPPR
jgi:hypothetical protein